jgi:hypothetical protein
MLNNRLFRNLFITLVLLLPVLSFGDLPRTSSSKLAHNPIPSAYNNPSSPDQLSATSSYYRIRRDVRRCASPFCGGYYVTRVNHNFTRCVNGRMAKQCYVAQIKWNNQPEVETAKALLRGNIMAKRYPRFGNLGAFVVTESWQAAGNQPPTGSFYRARDRGIRCVTHPCLTHHAAMLNSTTHRNIAGVELSGSADDLISEAQSAMTGVDGLIVSGATKTVTGPAGMATALNASQFYLRAGRDRGEVSDNRPPSKNPCKKTGCSGQICADEEMMSTCEWKPEYACYRKARCERQSNGKCGFTQTPELKACLARPPEQ